MNDPDTPSLTARPDRPPMKEWPPNGELSTWIAAQFETDHKGYAIDVGASDGISCNTTYMLESWRWTVLSVEPNPVFWRRLKELRAFVETCALDTEESSSAMFWSFDHNPEAYSALRPTFPSDFPPHLGWTKIQVPVKTLDQLIEKWQFPRLDALCVDTEGTEIDVLKGFDLAKWKPKAMVIESWVDPGPVDDYVAAFGYKKIGRSAHNSLYLLEA